MTSIIKSTFFPLAAVIACLFVALPGSSAGTAGRQPKTSGAPTASFSFDDGNGQADAGSYPAGAKFTITANMTFAPGGSVVNLDAVSYWFEQMGPLAPFYFSITLRDAGGSPFSDELQTQNLTYPQSLTPSNLKDLGGVTDNAVGAGTYLIANLTFAIDPSAPPGTYIVENTTSGGKTSVISDDQGHVFNIPKTTYTITVVPFKITSITQNPSNQHIVVQGQGVPSVVNRIEASPDLSPNSFQTLGAVTPDATGAFSFEDTNPGTVRFYHLIYP